jgi:hypothetical protein
MERLDDVTVKRYADGFRMIGHRKEAPVNVQTKNLQMAALLDELLELRNKK